MVHDGQSADDAAVAHAGGDPSPPSDAATPSAGAAQPPKARTWRDKGAATAGRVKTGSVGAFWSRLTAIEFMNGALMFAGLFLVCFFPFLAVVDAATGKNTDRAITVRMGLDPQAAHDVDALISTGHQTVSALSVIGAIVLVLFAIGIPGVLQAWYQKVYDQPASARPRRETVRPQTGLGRRAPRLYVAQRAGRRADRPGRRARAHLRV